jgi:hypothetical protein
MKSIAAVALAQKLNNSQIMASGILTGSIVAAVGITNLITIVNRLVPNSVVRGLQVYTCAHVCARMLTFAAHVCSCMLTYARTQLRTRPPGVYVRTRQHTRQHTSAYVRIRQHSSTYGSIRQHM